MTQFGADASVIELGVPDDDARAGRVHLTVRLRRRLLIWLVALLCVLTLAASGRGHPSLGDPLWTGPVSLNGFTVGARNLYMWRLDGKAAIALDLFTGRPRWSQDIADLPDSIMDVGAGAAVIATTPPFIEDGQWHPGSITLVRAADGQRIAQTTGESYLPSADGRLLLIFSRRFGGPDRCGESPAALTCSDITAWNLADGAMAWQLNLPPNAGDVASIVDRRVEALAEVDIDGTVKVRDVSTGTVAGTMSLRPDVLRAGQVGLAPGLLVTAIPGPEGIAVTAYRRPALSRAWSVVVPDFTTTDDQGDGQLYLSGCGSDVCMMVRGASTWVMNPATGSVTRPTSFTLVARLGDGVFLASPAQPEFFGQGPAVQPGGVVIDRDGRTLANLTAASLVDWMASGDRALVMNEGADRTEFRLIDDRGNVLSLGSVPGVHLTCHARADILGCSDQGGTLRVWRIPSR